MSQLFKEVVDQKCQLCNSGKDLSTYHVPPEGYPQNEIVVCGRCLAQIERREDMDNDYWRFLSDTMWSEVPAIQVITWRMLNRLKNETWAADNLDIMYLDESNLKWAGAASDEEELVAQTLHRDINGNVLENGDTVVLSKSLDVKGSSLNAKMGTVVKNIRLVEGNPEQIEGKIEGQTIVILTKYLRKHSS